MKKIIFILSSVLLIGIVGITASKTFIHAKKIHFHAGFQVVKDSKLVDFSGYQYMNIAPCTSDKNDHDNSNEQIEKGHLHDNIGDVVHIERSGSKWKDLFQNLHYEINYSKVTAYINGKQVSLFQDKEMQPYDSLVVFIGDSKNVTFLQNRVTKKHIEEVTKRSESCG